MLECSYKDRRRALLAKSRVSEAGLQAVMDRTSLQVIGGQLGWLTRHDWKQIQAYLVLLVLLLLKRVPFPLRVIGSEKVIQAQTQTQ
jgi:hypothetical protein